MKKITDYLNWNKNSDHDYRKKEDFLCRSEKMKTET